MREITVNDIQYAYVVGVLVGVVCAIAAQNILKKLNDKQ